MNTIIIKKEIAIDIASDFVSYSSEEEVANFIYPLFKETIYQDFCVDTIGDIIAAITYDNNAPETIKDTENVVNYVTGYIADYLVTLSDDDFTNFAITHYDDDFDFNDFDEDDFIMSNDEYIKNSADVCPVCRGREISGSEIEVGAGSATRDVECACGRKWYEEFEATEEKDECECGGELEYGEVHASGTSCYQEVSCECGETWENDYEIKSFEMIN